MEDRKTQKLRQIWNGMKKRCNNKNYEHYQIYGGRGITVCESWSDEFSVFLKWSLLNGYEEGLQIDRIDTNGNYEPNNCRWVTPKENSNNKRNNKLYTINSITKTYAQWSEQINIHPSTFAQRVKNGWSDEELLLGKRKRNNIRRNTGQVYTFKDGIVMTISEMAKIAKVSQATMHDRIKNGFSDDEILLQKSDIKKKFRNVKYRSNTITVEIEGETKSIQEWAVIAGISYSSMIRRYNKGLRGKELIKSSRNKS